LSLNKIKRINAEHIVQRGIAIANGDGFNSSSPKVSDAPVFGDFAVALAA
jgi:hypothetical protein